MCGILGLITEGNDIPKRFNLALEALEHRGPDGHGVWKSDDSKITLAHRRLSIIDLQPRSSQPMKFKNLVISFNGEVFNYLEIRNELIQEGYSFDTTSDTEVILKAWHKWGVESQNRFNGMWAIAIYDIATRQLWITRDRFGIKPLYFIQKDEFFAFASEQKALAKLLPKTTFNPEIMSIIAQGGFSWASTDKSWVEGVTNLAAGSTLIFSDGEISTFRWYKLTRIPVTGSYKDKVDYFKELIFDAVSLRLRSDVDVATCLSGGVDSGSITSIIHHLEKSGSTFQHYNHSAYCASFPNSNIDESDLAGHLAKSKGVKLATMPVEIPSVTELEMAMGQCDGPMHSLAFYPISSLYRLISSHGIKVTIDGQGPDEMMGGYKALDYALKGALQDNNFPYARDVFMTYRNVHPERSDWYTVREALSQYGKTKIKNLLNVGTPYSYWKQSGPEFLTNLFDRHLHFQFFCDPLPGILQQFDRCSMAHGVECRMPFMDYRIVEYLYSLNIQDKVGGGFTKRILRSAMEGILDDRIRLNKRKIGFNAPILEWFRGPLKKWMLEILNSNLFIESIYFDGPALLKQFNEFVDTDNPQWSEAWRFWGPVHITWCLDQNNVS